MKTQKFRIEKQYKETLARYDLKFIYKDRLQILFILPEEEKDYVEELEHDKVMIKILKAFYLFSKIFGKNLTNYFARTKGVDFLLEGKGGVIHSGDVYLEVIEGENK